MTTVTEIKETKKPRKAKVTELKVSKPKPKMTPFVSLEITGDHEPKMLEAPVSAFILDTVKKTELTAVNNSVNKCHLSGKGLGTMLLTDANTIAVSLNGEESTVWVDSLAGASITPLGTVTPVNTTIGDKPRTHKRVPIASHLVPQHMKLELQDATHTINLSEISGKQLGAIVTDELGHIYMAHGSETTDMWLNLTDGTDITPLGATVPTTGVLGDKAKSRQSELGALPLALVDLSSLASITHPINLTRVGGKAKGTAYALETGDIVIALGAEPESEWIKVSDGSTVTPA